MQHKIKKPNNKIMENLKNYLLALFLMVSTFTFAQQENPFTINWHNGFKLESADKQFNLKFGGRIMFDQAFFSQNNALDNSFGNLSTKNGFEFRRARLFTSGTIYGNIDYKLQFDFAGGNAVLKDAYITIKKIPTMGHIRIGHFKEPFRFESLTSSKYMTFMERNFGSEFSADRNSGIMIFNDFLNHRISYQTGLFRNADSFGNDKKANNGYAITSRLAVAIIKNKEKKQLLHLGVSYSYRKPENNTYHIASRPEAHLSGIKYIDTNTITDVNNVSLVNVESAFVSGPIAIQAEYLNSSVKSLTTYNFSSYYAQASYFLTGESKSYKSPLGGFGRVHPKENFGGKNKGIGAWEIALRYSKADLNSKSIFGGEESNITLGLNWYLNPATRIMLNHVWANIKNAGNANVFEMRFQIDF